MDMHGGSPCNSLSFWGSLNRRSMSGFSYCSFVVLEPDMSCSCHHSIVPAGRTPPQRQAALVGTSCLLQTVARWGRRHRWKDETSTAISLWAMTILSVSRSHWKSRCISMGLLLNNERLVISWKIKVKVIPTSSNFKISRGNVCMKSNIAHFTLKGRYTNIWKKIRQCCLQKHYKHKVIVEGQLCVTYSRGAWSLTLSGGKMYLQRL